MKKVEAYFKDSYKELLERVTWPTWEQLQQSTMIVLVATLVITALVWVMDLASNGILKFLVSYSQSETLHKVNFYFLISKCF